MHYKNLTLVSVFENEYFSVPTNRYLVFLVEAFGTLYKLTEW
jgi:hypothetical protein